MIFSCTQILMQIKFQFVNCCVCLVDFNENIMESFFFEIPKNVRDDIDEYCLFIFIKIVDIRKQQGKFTFIYLRNGRTMPLISRWEIGKQKIIDIVPLRLSR